jgi:Ala-tRNA(Pro) deacylase
MSIAVALKEYLDKNNVQFETLTHTRAFTAQEIAAAVHCPGKEMAKAVIVKMDGRFSMLVISASDRIDFERIKSELGLDRLQLATEDEFQDLFADCEIGAMPIFGNLYNLPVYCSDEILQDDQICFNAGNHVEAIRMATSDFVKLVQPKIVIVSEKVTA